MPLNSSNLILLTGAGFTANFGGFLAREMWSKIFNHPKLQAHANLREMLLTNFDFEEIYFEVFNQPFTDEEKQNFREAVESAYHDLDHTIKDWVQNDDNPLSLNTYNNGGLGSLFEFFTGNGPGKNFIFTLNQDLFFERQWKHRAFGAKWFTEECYQPRVIIERKHFITLPTAAEIENKIKKDFLSHMGLTYIKLHGSYGWLSQDGSTSGAMVLGKNKPQDIEKEPLLKWYFELFREVIREKDKKLLIIGYGFRDEHINDILLDGIKNYGLKLYIINPTDPEKFRQSIPEPVGEGLYLWDGVYGYFPYNLRQMFPPSQETTTMLAEIKRSLAA